MNPFPRLPASCRKTQHSVAFARIVALLLALGAGFTPSIPSQAAVPEPFLTTEPLLIDEGSEWRPVEALAVRVFLRHSGSATDDVPDAEILVDAGKAWSEAVTLALTGPDGQPVTLPWVRSGNPDSTPPRLTAGNQWSMGFYLAADPTRSLPPGRYSLQSTLEIPTGPGWTGRITSPSAGLNVVPNPTPGSGILVSVVGGESLAPGDPWIVSLALVPPLRTSAEDALRSRYQVTVRDQSDRAMAWTFDPPATPPTLPDLAIMEDVGLGPILVVLPRTATAQAAPGTYELTAQWQAGADGPVVSNRIPVRIQARTAAESMADRRPAVLRRLFAEATALLWRAEFSSTAQITALVARAAPLLVEAERQALENFVAAPRTPDTAAVAAEFFLLSGDFDGARAFAGIALNTWRPLPVTPEQQAALPPPKPPLEFTELLETIELRASRNPGRVLPYLRPALAEVRGFDSGNPDSLAPGEAAWAISARASSEYRSTDYSASQATNAPNVPSHADHPKAWAPRLADSGEEWIELKYSPSLRAAGIHVIQSFNPGAVMRLDVIDESGASATVWTGPDTTVYPPREIGILRASFPPTDQLIAKVRVTLDTRRIAGWNEIDAVRLIAAPSLPPASPELAFQLNPASPGVLTIPAWPAGFRLERATRLVPPDWSPLATNPPATIRLDREAEFLRLRGTP